MLTVRIIADDRESQAGVIEALRRQNETEVSVRRLALGIICWNNSAASKPFSRPTSKPWGVWPE